MTIAISLILGGIAIILIEKKQKRLGCFVAQGAPRNDGGELDCFADSDEEENIKAKTAFLIGCFQALAMIPGVSRSGATIMGGILLGLKKKPQLNFHSFWQFQQLLQQVFMIY